MNRIIVGILPQVRLKINDNPYNDKYEFLDLYTKKIIEAGGIPIGICLNDGQLDYSSLELCDAFLIPGGNKVEKCYYKTIYYAILHNKPLLGICLGLESLAIFSMIFENLDVNKNINFNDFIEKYKELKKENDGTLLERIKSPNIHGDVIVNYDNINEARHDINIDKNSLIYSIYQKESMSVVSLHSYNPKWIGKHFKITALAPDGVIEAIEYNKEDYFILGVHFHPELENNHLIFKKLINEGKKRRKKQ